MDLNKERLEILTQSAEARARDVMLHQINIDNYRAAISEIENSHSKQEGMKQFSDQLRGLLESSLIEQRKEKIMLRVIQSQLEAK